jgi:hypothetical protein
LAAAGEWRTTLTLTELRRKIHDYISKNLYPPCFILITEEQRNEFYKAGKEFAIYGEKTVNGLMKIEGIKVVVEGDKNILDVRDEQTCIWEQDKDWDNESLFHTSCDNAYEITTGTPTDNHMNFCTYCGKKIVTQLAEREKDEE